mmetsp:Transcript_23689/g.38032  ORF Transcript_23689/g.38032 Transcript_23689/m.38032 type:complete len:475 (+) Transcript_23689:185-1609(+)
MVTQGSGSTNANESIKSGLKSGGEQSKLVEKKGEMTVGEKKEKAEFFNDSEWAKIRGKFNVDPDFLNGFSFKNLSEGGGKGGSRMTRTNGGKFLIKEMSAGDHQALLERTKDFVAIMLQDDTLIVTFFAHFKIKNSVFVAMANALPSGIKWTYLFDLKGCRDDKAMAMEGKKVPAVHKRCFSCLQCWYCCDMESCSCCSCYSEERATYYKGKTVAFECPFSFTSKQVAHLQKLIKNDTERLNKLEVMDYSLILAYRDEELQSVKNGEISEETKELLRTSKFVCVLGNKVRIYFMGIIDFLQDWNIKKDIARCIKACAPHPLSTVPPPLYAEQFNRLGERMKGDAEDFKILEDKKESDVLGSIEVKLKEEAEKQPAAVDAEKGEPAILEGGTAVGGAIPIVDNDEPQQAAADEAKNKGSGGGASNKDNKESKEKGEESEGQRQSKDAVDKLGAEDTPMDNVPIGSTPRASELPVE